MHRSSAYTMKRMLQAELQAFRSIQELCDHELKSIHPDDIAVKANIIKERDFIGVVMCRLMKQLDDNRQDIIKGIE